MYRNAVHVNRIANFFLDRDAVHLHHYAGQVGGTTLKV